MRSVEEGGLRNGNECAPCTYGRVTKKPTALDIYYMLTLKSKLGDLCNGKKNILLR